jgi:hypothetical protein
LFEKNRFRDYRAGAAWSPDPAKGDKDMDEEDWIQPTYQGLHQKSCTTLICPEAGQLPRTLQDNYMRRHYLNNHQYFAVVFTLNKDFCGTDSDHHRMTCENKRVSLVFWQSRQLIN